MWDFAPSSMKLLNFKVIASTKELNTVQSPLSLHNKIKTPENTAFSRVVVTNLFLLFKK
jgi:hypothetical protein